MTEDKDIITDEDIMELDIEITRNLNETGKWARFIAVTMFVLAGLIFFLFLAFGSYWSYLISGFDDYGGGFGGRKSGLFILLMIALLIVGGIFVTAYYFLISFANKVRSGVEAQDIFQVNKGLNSLKIHFIIIGIFSALSVLASLLTLF